LNTDYLCLQVRFSIVKNKKQKTLFYRKQGAVKQRKLQLMKTLGQNIRLLRHEKGWSQEIVSKQLDISIPAYSKIETGITDVNLSRLEQIAGLFKITTVQLLSIGEAKLDDKVTLLETVNKKLAIREMEVIELQKKVIELFEELRQFKETA